MPSPLQWRLLDAAVVAGSFRDPSEEFMRPFREAAFAGETPWHSPASPLAARTREVLLATMASHASTPAQLRTTLESFDAAPKSRGESWITARAGEILIERSRHGQLPGGWEDAVKGAAHANRPSASYWGRAILRAGGVSAPEKEMDADAVQAPVGEGLDIG